MEPKPITLSVAIAVHNEASTIGECLKSIKDIAQEIVVVDGSSTDKTVSIAEQYGARVIKTENRTNFHINKQMAIDECRGNWILQLDADERVSSMLAKEIVSATLANPVSAPAAYYLKRRNYFLGRWMSKGGMYPDLVIRLFQKGKARLPQANVHELMSVDGTTAYLKEDLLHVADPVFSRYLKRSNRYTTLQAEEWLKDGKLGTDTWTILLYTILKPFIRFATIYFRHKGMLDGFPGFVFAVYSGLHIRTSYIKYWEKKVTNTPISLQSDWD